MFLVAVEDILEGDCALEGAPHGAIGDGEQRPALKVRESAGEWEIGKQDRRPFRAQAFGESHDR
jgi:hypothetical protein